MHFQTHTQPKKKSAKEERHKQKGHQKDQTIDELHNHYSSKNNINEKLKYIYLKSWRTLENCDDKGLSSVLYSSLSLSLSPRVFYAVLDYHFFSGLTCSMSHACDIIIISFFEVLKSDWTCHPKKKKKKVWLNSRFQVLDSQLRWVPTTYSFFMTEVSSAKFVHATRVVLP